MNGQREGEKLEIEREKNMQNWSVIGSGFCLYTNAVIRPLHVFFITEKKTLENLKRNEKAVKFNYSIVLIKNWVM